MKTIKFIYTILIILIIINISTFGQIKYIGGSLGYNLSKLNYKNDLQGYDFNFKNGFKGGLFTEYQISAYISVRGEINYSMRGTEYGTEAKLGFPKHKFIQKLNYVEVPIILQYNIPVEFLLKPKIFIGPEISLLLNAKIEYVENDVSIAEADEKDHFKSTEYGIVFGAGTDYLLPGGKFLFDVRYYYGLGNINKIEASKITSNSISFNVGYAFSIL